MSARSSTERGMPLQEARESTSLEGDDVNEKE
jgi:hypothetical protein